MGFAFLNSISGDFGPFLPSFLFQLFGKPFIQFPGLAFLLARRNTTSFPNLLDSGLQVIEGSSYNQD